MKRSSGFKVLEIIIVFNLALFTLDQPVFSTFKASFGASMKTSVLNDSTQAKLQPNNTNSISSIKNNALFSTGMSSHFASFLKAIALDNITQVKVRPSTTKRNSSRTNHTYQDECIYASSSTFSLKPPSSTIVVTANLIPTFPATDILEDTLDSLSFIKGLEPNTPIIIAVDGIEPKMDSPNNKQRLQDWISNVQTMFKCHSNVQILSSSVHLHISNTLRMALNQVSTEFVYIMEHDFPFIKEVDHELLVTSMHESKELQIVRFNKRGNWDRRRDYVDCSHTIKVAGMDYIFAKWSNNNHFTTKKYYDWLFQEIGPAPRPPEHKMMYMQRHNCTLYGQHLYGSKSDGPFLHHINGKRESYNRTHAYNNHQRCPNSTRQVPSSVLPWVRCPTWL
jgi:hypothetical protein